MHGIFSEISIVIVMAGVLGMLMSLIKQPAIVGYVITGLILGPLGYLQLNNPEVINALSEIGITLLLFMVGLELSFKDLRQVGPVAAVVGFFQIAIISSIGTAIFTTFGLPLPAAIFLGLGLGVSSTIIAVKMISEKGDLDSLYGKIVLGILIVEDIVSVIALAIVSTLSAGQSADFASAGIIILKLIVLFAIILGMSRRFFPWVMDKLSHSSELVFLFSLAWGLGFATLVSLDIFNLKPEIGGFLAGLALANTAQHAHISSRMRPLRDFFLILFFILLGSQLVLKDFGQLAIVAVGVTLLAVVVKPIVTFIVMTLVGYKGRTSFLVATSLAHISEFGIILAVIGWQAGFMSEMHLSLITISAIMSYLFATYLISHNEKIAHAGRRFLALWDPQSHVESNFKSQKLKNHIILIGAHRTGQSVIRSLEELHKKLIVVDFNPAVTHRLAAEGINTLFGDIADPDIQEKANIDQAKLVISTVPGYQDNLAVIEATRLNNKKAKIVLSATSDWEARKLYDRGADYVLMPHFLSGLQLAEILKKDVDLKNVSKLRERDLDLIGRTA